MTGLGIVPGKVVRFKGPAFESRGGTPGLKVPHMGWNRLNVVRPQPIVEGMPADAMAYFVHSYYGVPADPQWTAVTSDHGIEFTCAVARGGLFASQFHPEKSGDVGIQMLRNFIGMIAGRREDG